jgi:hypothetical protein
MAAVWPIGDFLDNLKANLDGRMTGSLANVEVYTAPVDAEEYDDDRESVVLGLDVNTDEDVEALRAGGHRNQEENIVECQLMSWDIVVDGETGESVAKTTRDRALLIFGEVETEIRTDYRQSLPYVKMAKISRKRLNQGVYPQADGRARACVIEFDITITLRTDVT